MSKVAIVGMGRVGSAVAYNLGLLEVVDTILAIDYNVELAKMQVRDLTESFIISESKTRIEVNNYENLGDADIMIITAGAPVTKVVDRLELFDSSKKIITSIVEQSLKAGFKGIYIVASNPVDVMTDLVHILSGVDDNFVIGSGTILDNARFKNELSQELRIDPKYIESNCIGEHGNSLVPLYDSVKINGQLLDEYLVQKDIIISKDQITERVKNSGPKIFAVKGATEFGIASSLSSITKAILNDTKEQLTVTNLMNVEGVGEIYIPDFVKVGKNGYEKMEVRDISLIEYDQFVESAKVLGEYKKLIK